MAKPKHVRTDYERRTTIAFKKRYGKRIYFFRHEVIEIAGYTSATTLVRRKKKGDSPFRVGELVHYVFRSTENDN